MRSRRNRRTLRLCGFLLRRKHTCRKLTATVVAETCAVSIVSSALGAAHCGSPNRSGERSRLSLFQHLPQRPTDREPSDTGGVRPWRIASVLKARLKHFRSDAGWVEQQREWWPRDFRAAVLKGSDHLLGSQRVIDGDQIAVRGPSRRVVI